LLRKPKKTGSGRPRTARTEQKEQKVAAVEDLVLSQEQLDFEASFRLSNCSRDMNLSYIIMSLE